MHEEPFRWVEAIANRREYIEDRIRREEERFLETLSKGLSLLEEEIATITIGTDLRTSTQAVELASLHPHLFATVGIHR